MSPKIVAIVNQKGGPGKTTLAMHLAGTLGRRKRSVLVVDADPQGTATRWAASAPDDAPFPAVIASLADAGPRLHREIARYLPNYEFVIIDCPPSADSPVAQSALLVADLALVPLVPSPPDLWAGVAIRAVIERATAVNGILKARLLINQRKPHTRLAAQTVKLLPQYGIELCKAQIGDREAFRHAAAFGQTVHHLGPAAQAAIDEIDLFTDEVLSIIKQDKEG